jgi:hypothetical protein
LRLSVGGTGSRSTLFESTDSLEVLETLLVIKALNFSKPSTQLHNVIEFCIGRLHVEDLVHTSLNMFAEFLIVKVMWGTFKKHIGGLNSLLELPERAGILVHTGKHDACIILPVIGEMRFVEKGHEVIEAHGLEMFVLKFNPINEMDILNAIKSMFDDLVSGDVLIVGEPPAGPSLHRSEELGHQ